MGNFDSTPKTSSTGSINNSICINGHCTTSPSGSSSVDIGNNMTCVNGDCRPMTAQEKKKYDAGMAKLNSNLSDMDSSLD